VRDEPDSTSTADRRRRIDEVFGDVLPATTADERDQGHDREPGDREDWYLRNRPPHHDRG